MPGANLVVDGQVAVTVDRVTDLPAGRYELVLTVEAEHIASCREVGDHPGEESPSPACAAVMGLSARGLGEPQEAASGVEITEHRLDFVRGNILVSR